ncbi:bifunctional 3,4-dihydroxy-2-butanone-4-phosphate synthase/GTP cyclohydrolase II [bacterium]|nr:bifunctional 3,4-dihydroxy-2-butanone-4-phosphate synthase/GTP cyclohydrolase II [bacterium]
MSHFSTIKKAIQDISNGKMVIVVDDEDRENEGDLIMAADFATPDAINFMIKQARGLVCVPVTDDILDRLEITEMVKENSDPHKTAFTVSFDAHSKHGISTGISAYDRAKSVRILIHPNSTKDDIISPGHLFPLRARRMGVLKRAGHTEAAVDLARLAGLQPAGVICEIIKQDGDMARMPDLVKFAKKHSLSLITIKDLIQYRIQNESFIELVETISLPTDIANFDLHCYLDKLNDKYHYALTYGKYKVKPTLVRVHSECITGDVFGSLRCDCAPQLHTAMKMVADNGSGIVLYMSQEGRGIGIANKLKAYKLQENGLDTVEANEELGFSDDLRDYGVGAQILLDLGVKEMNLITNNPRKIIGLKGFGLSVKERIPIKIEPGKFNQSYLKTKQKKMGHML